MKRKIPHEWVKQWEESEGKLRSSGFSKWAAYGKIAELYKVTSPTVYAHLTDGYLEKRRKRNREQVRRYYQKCDVKARRRIYSTKYMALRRHLSDLLLQLVDKHEEVTLEEIAGRVAELEGIRMETDTMKRSLQRYKQESGSAPIEETKNSGLYALNEGFYAIRSRTDTLGR